MLSKKTQQLMSDKIQIPNFKFNFLYYRRPSDIDSPMIMTPTATSPSTPNTASIFNFPKT